MERKGFSWDIFGTLKAKNTKIKKTQLAITKILL